MYGESQDRDFTKNYLRRSLHVPESDAGIIRDFLMDNDTHINKYRMDIFRRFLDNYDLQGNGGLPDYIRKIANTNALTTDDMYAYFRNYPSSDVNPYESGKYSYYKYSDPNNGFGTEYYIPKDYVDLQKSNTNLPTSMEGRQKGQGPIYYKNFKGDVGRVYSSVRDRNTNGFKYSVLNNKPEEVTLSKPIVQGYSMPKEYSKNNDNWSAGINTYPHPKLPDSSVTGLGNTVKTPTIESIIKTSSIFGNPLNNASIVGYGAPQTYVGALDDKKIMPVLSGRDELHKDITETIPITDSGNYYLDPISNKLEPTNITVDSQGNRWYRNNSVNRDVPLDVGISIEDIIKHLFR